MPMKVILLQEVAGLGKPGDVKTVADGFARNYLMPRQLVTPATPAALATLQQRVSAEQKRQETIHDALVALRERLGGVTLRFAVRVGGQGRLYGSVTSQDIVNALKAQEGIIVDRRAVVLGDPLRTLGTHKVHVRLSQGFEPEITVELTASEN